MALTLAITARTLFDADVESGAAEVGQAMQLLQENFIRRFDSLIVLPMWVPTPQNLRIRRAVRRSMTSSTASSTSGARAADGQKRSAVAAAACPR